MDHDQEVMTGSNPGTICEINVSNASYHINIQENNENIGSQMGHTKKHFFKERTLTIIKLFYYNCYMAFGFTFCKLIHWFRQQSLKNCFFHNQFYSLFNKRSLKCNTKMFIYFGFGFGV
jgi:hypothetical protein